jgi:hypothetical protein
MGHIIGSVFGIYLIMLWAILFVAIADLPLELLLIALVVISTPILIIRVQYTTLKEKYNILQQAGQALNDSERAIEARQPITGLTSYVFLVFDLLRPSEDEIENGEKNEIEELRASLKETTKKVISEIIFQGIFLVLLFIQFLIPEFVRFLEQGGSFIVLLVILGLIIAVLIARWIVFLYWRLLARRWLRFYQGFIEWGEELERLFPASSDERSGGGSSW